MVEKKTITAQKSLLRLPDGTYVVPFTNTSGAFEIGDIGQALFVDETKGTRRILNGQLVDINENTKPFLDYLLAVKTQYPQLFVTEEEWQAEKASNVFGQVSKFVLNAETHTTYTYNATTVGTLIKENGIVSGFSGSNYMIIEDIPTNVTSFEIVFKANSGLNSSRTYTSICGQIDGNYTTPQITGTVPNIGAGISADGSSWPSGNTTIALEDNTDYWFKVEWNGSQRIFSVSKDGELYEDVSVLEQTAINWTTKLAIGIDYDVDDESKYWAGSIDLNESYININGERWWNGVSTEIKPANVRIPAIYNEEGYKNLINRTSSNKRTLAKAYRNGATWYNWYSDGWIEQGGRGTATMDAVTTITYPKSFNDINYTIATTPYSTTNSFNKGSGDWMVAKANGSFNWHCDTYGGWVEYIVKGYIAKPTLADYDIKDSNGIYFIQIAHEHYTPQLVRNNLSTINPYTLFDYKYSYNPLNNASWLVSVKQQNPRQTYTSAYEALCVELNDAIQTNETVNLPSGGRYTKHLQTLYYDQSKLTLVGSPSITLNGLLSNANEANHVKLNVNTAISTATSYTLKLRFQFITDSTIISTSTAVTPNALLIRTVGDKVQTQISLSNTDWDYTLETANTFIEGNWYDLKLTFNNANGYTFEISDDLGATYTTEWFLREELTRLTPESNFLLFGASYNIPGVPIDLKTIQFIYDGTIINCNKQENLVWDSREHAPTEANYDKKFIVDRINETFRLPLKVDRELNNGEELYFYIGDVAQNSALIDIGRITEQLARLQAEVDKLKG